MTANGGEKVDAASRCEKFAARIERKNRVGAKARCLRVICMKLHCDYGRPPVDPFLVRHSFVSRRRSLPPSGHSFYRILAAAKCVELRSVRRF